jgi:hypothetical protein
MAASEVFRSLNLFRFRDIGLAFRHCWPAFDQSHSPPVRPREIPELPDDFVAIHGVFILKPMA